jgi:HTH-type transcriptional regulator/antitoxin HigA
MELPPVRSDEELGDALTLRNELLSGPLEAEDLDRLHALCLLIADYEKRRYPLPAPDPVRFVEFRLQALGMVPAALAERLQVSPVEIDDFLSRRKPPSLELARRLHEELGVPGDVMLAPYRLAATVHAA